MARNDRAWRGARFPTGADRYLIRLMLPRMGMALAIALVALLIERLLRLFDLMTGMGTGIGPLLGMLASLLPHYVGLALPIAFCIGMLSVLASLCRASELDVLEAGGWSMRRIGVPFVLCGVLLALISLALFGYVQPYSRYAYRTMIHAAQEAGWSGRVEQAVFVRVGEDLVLSAAEIDPTGQVLERVFVLQRRNGDEIATTAPRALVIPKPERRTVTLLLLDGRSMLPGGARVDFDRLRLEHEFDLANNPFRPRGGSERELTLNELKIRMTGADGLPPEPRYTAEFHGRLVRSLSLVAVALLSVPLGVSRKRSSVWPRIAIAVAILVAFDHLLKLAESLGDLGQLDPPIALWSVLLAFFAFSAWLYAATPGQGARSDIRIVLRLIDDARVERWVPWLAAGRRGSGQ